MKKHKLLKKQVYEYVETGKKIYLCAEDQKTLEKAVKQFRQDKINSITLSALKDVLVRRENARRDTL